MKNVKWIFIALIISASMMAFGLVNGKYERDNVITCAKPKLDLVYNIDSRFNTITKKEVTAAKTIADIVPEDATESIHSYQYSRVSILEDHVETDQREIGENGQLTKAQLTLLKRTDYSSNYYVRADYIQKDNYSNNLAYQYLTYFMSIIPENEAYYLDGKDSFINYLKEASKDYVGNIEDHVLEAGKFRFTVNKDGTIGRVKMLSTSGYSRVDDQLTKILVNCPGKWQAATNENGEPVAQDYVFFFGKQGC